MINSFHFRAEHFAELNSAAAIQEIRVSAASNKLTKPEINRLMKHREELNPTLREMLGLLTIIPKGVYKGSMTAHRCHSNSIAQYWKQGLDLYVGYIVTPSDGITLISHSFNVKDGKVVEYTSKLNNWDLYTYVGVKVLLPPAKHTVQYDNAIRKPAWVLKQQQGL